MGLNISVIMGRLVADPEIRHTPNNVAVTTFTIANDQGSGDKKKTLFIDIVAWRNTAEFICKYFKKGQMMIVQGTIQTRSYQDKDGKKCKAFEIVADTVNFADSKRNDNGSNEDKPDISNSEPKDDFEELPTDDDLPF